MNLGNLGKVESCDTILDQAFKNASKKASSTSQKKYNTRLAKMKETNKVRVDVAGRSIASYLDKVSAKFPYIEDLHPFYQEYIRLSIDEDKYKKSLAALRWAMKKATEFSAVTIRNITRSKGDNEPVELRRAFYGRVSSIVKQIKKHLLYLDSVRKEFRKFPSIKTKYPNVILAGYPNVGKSTLLKNLTGANPEINNYSFTTKGINVGYYTEENQGLKIQFIDVPGVFDRPKEEMNHIELKAYAAVSHLPDIIVVVFDISLSSGYGTKEQLNLLKQILTVEKPIIVALNKVDLIDKNAIKKERTLIKEKIKKYKNAKIIEVSADKKKGLDELIKVVKERLPKKEILEDVSEN